MMADDLDANAFEQVIARRFISQQNLLRLSNFPFHWRWVLNYKVWQFLQKLYLGSCKIDNQDKIQEVIKYKWQNLTVLNLNFNKIKGPLLQNLMKKKWIKLQTLQLQGNQLEDDDLVIIFNKMSKIPNLKNINLANNNFQYPCQIFQIYEDIMKNLTVLNLNNNNIGSEGISILVKIKFNSLHKLFISSCRIGNKGAAHLVKGDWKNINQIRLSQNFIGLSGVLPLAQNNWGQISQLWADFHAISALCGIFFGQMKTQIFLIYDKQNKEIKEYLRQINKNKKLKQK